MLIWAMANRSYTKWTSTPTGSTEIREYGIIRYLRITTESTGPRGTPQTTTLVDWVWQPVAVVVNIVVAATLIALLRWLCWRSVRKDRLVGLCDECGYDLTGLQSNACPECGSPIDEP